LHALVVWHLLSPLMNSFNKTEAAIFLCRLCFLRVFPFISLKELVSKGFSFTNLRAPAKLYLQSHNKLTINKCLSGDFFIKCKHSFSMRVANIVLCSEIYKFPQCFSCSSTMLSSLSWLTMSVLSSLLKHSAHGLVSAPPFPASVFTVCRQSFTTCTTVPSS